MAIATDSKAFCVLAWNHMYTNPDGTFSPCCVFSERMHDESGRELNVRTHSLEEIWNSKAMRDMRERMAAGKGVAGCAVCYKVEKANGGGSYRTWANDYFLNGEGAVGGAREAVERAAANGQVVADRPKYFDVRLGNLCNLKCRSCDSSFSSSIERDPVHSKYSVPLKVLKSRFAEEPWYESDQLRNELFDISKDVVLLQLAGGEPTINRIQMGWLQHLVDVGRAKDVTVTAWSNFTTLNARFYELMTQFKQFSLMMSIDGHREVLEYMRFPAKWEQIESNVQLLKEKVARPVVTVYPVVQMCNALNLPQLFAWAHGHGMHVRLNRLHWPDQLHYNLLPPKAKAQAIAQLEAYLARPGVAGREPFFSEVTNLINEFKQLPDPDPKADAARIRKFWKFTRDLDASRGQNIDGALPELTRYLHEYYGEACDPMSPAYVAEGEATAATA